MKRLSNRDLAILIVMVVVLLPIGFSIGRLSKEPEVITQPFDTSKYDKSMDSLISLKEASDRIIYALTIEIDSLKKLKENNHINTNNNVGTIKKFTPTARHRWADSVLRAEGIRHNMSIR